MPSLKNLVASSSRWKSSLRPAELDGAPPPPLASPTPTLPHRRQPTPANVPRSFSAGALPTVDASAAHPLLATPVAGHSQRSVSYNDDASAYDISGVPSDEWQASRATGEATGRPRIATPRDPAGVTQADPSTEPTSPLLGTLSPVSPAAGPKPPPPPLLLDPRLASTQPPSSPFRPLFDLTSPPALSTSSATPPRPSRAPPNLPPQSSASPSEAASRIPPRVITPFETLLAKTIQEEMFKLLQAHKGDLVANESRSAADALPARPVPAPAVLEGISDEEAAFHSQFPELPPSPETVPARPSTNPFDDPPVSSFPPATLTDFEALVESTTSLLVWRLKRMVEGRIEEGEATQRRIMARAQIEFDQLGKEYSDETRRREKAEEEVLGYKLRLAEAATAARRADMELEKVTLRLSAEQLSHHENLEGAAAAAQGLQERVEVLQTLLNEVDQQSPRNRNTPEDDGDDIWRELVDSQSEVLSNHAQALSKLASVLVCPTCSSTMNGATTLSCGHSGCLTCVQDWFNTGRKSCPECRVETTGVLAPAFALREVIAGLEAMGMSEEDE